MSNSIYRPLLIASLVIAAVVSLNDRKTYAVDPNSSDLVDVIPARCLVGRRVEGLPNQIDKVSDLLVDLETSQVVAAVFRERVGEDISVAMTLPIIALRQTQSSQGLQPWVTEAMIRKAIGQRRLSQRELTRERIGEQFRSINKTPYWKVRRTHTYGVRAARFDRNDQLLTNYSDLVGKPITDSENLQIGSVQEVVVAPDSFDVAYLVIENTAAQLQAIPLGAFEVGQDDQWKINLDRETILSRPTFEKGNLPRNVDRGWVEYVAVRYGNEGVQQEQKDDTQ